MSDAAGKFVPACTPETAFWWESCRQHRLLIQRCPDCEAYQFYPRPSCARCGGARPEWVEAAGSGAVSTFTVCHVPVSRAYSEDLPYVVALVRLDEGPTMMCNIIDCDPASVRVGLPVEVVFESRSEDITLPQFRPLPAGKGR